MIYAFSAENTKLASLFVKLPLSIRPACSQLVYLEKRKLPGQHSTSSPESAIIYINFMHQSTLLIDAHNSPAANLEWLVVFTPLPPKQLISCVLDLPDFRRRTKAPHTRLTALLAAVCGCSRVGRPKVRSDLILSYQVRA